MYAFILFCGLALMSLNPAYAEPPMPETQPQTVLLHGLARSSSSMNTLAAALEDAGHRVCNIDYPSRHHPIEVLAHQYVLPELHNCFGTNLPKLNFVTHSLGGIILRQLRHDDALSDIARAVMLGPPNGGSEVVDKLGGLAPFRWLNGPAGSQLSTAADSVPNRLGPADFELGVIAGNFSINLILSTLIPGDDDGKVSLERAQLAGMTDSIVLPVSHPFLMKNPLAIAQTLHFLTHGQFKPQQE